MNTRYKKKSLTFLIVAGILLTALIGLNKLLNKEDLVPTNIDITALNTTKTKISWKTLKPTVGTVVYSQYEDLCTEQTNDAYCLVAREESPTTLHQIILDNLLSNKTYYFAIKTDNDLYKSTNSFSSFKTNDLSFGITQEVKLTLDGISDPQKPTLTQKVQQTTSAVLGISTHQTANNTTKIKYKEFEKAIKVNDLNYDFNKDNIVDTTDYPLYIEFITNQED